MNGTNDLPITSIISIAIDKRDFNPAVQQESQILKPAISGIIAYAPESAADGRGALGPVQRDAHSLLNMFLIEETLVERRRSRSWIQRRDIVVIPSTVQDVRIENIRPAERLRRLANIVHRLVDSQVQRVAQRGCFAAVYDLVAASSGALEAVGHVEVLGLVDGLDAVGVVVGHGGVSGPLDEAVDAAVDDHEGVDVQERVLAVVVDKGAVGDLLVLGFEVGREGGAVAAALLLSCLSGLGRLWFGFRVEGGDLRRTLLRSRFASRWGGRLGTLG
jgi:hypothetical protein